MSRRMSHRELQRRNTLIAVSFAILGVLLLATAWWMGRSLIAGLCIGGALGSLVGALIGVLHSGDD